MSNTFSAFPAFHWSPGKNVYSLTDWSLEEQSLGETGHNKVYDQTDATA